MTTGMPDYRLLTGEARRDALHATALARESAGELKLLLFYGHKPNGRSGAGPWMLSNWWPAPFTRGGDVYPTAEHWMMAEKARLFDDRDALAAVLAATGPAAAKAAGRAVRGFEEKVWRAHRYEIVRAGCRWKFTSDPLLLDFLLSTRGSLLVEASPTDRIWGIGVGALHPSAGSPSRWPGLNLLGYALTDVREELRAG